YVYSVSTVASISQIGRTSPYYTYDNRKQLDTLCSSRFDALSRKAPGRRTLRERVIVARKAALERKNRIQRRTCLRCGRPCRPPRKSSRPLESLQKTRSKNALHS